MGTRIALIISLLVLLASCSKNDPTFSLVGTWQQASIINSGCFDQSLNGTQTCSASCGTMVFTATTVATNGGVPVAYTISGNTLTIGSSGYSTSYAVTASTLTLSTQYSAASGGCLVVTKYNKVS